MPHYHGGTRPRMLEPVKLSDISPGPVYPVSLADAKAQLRVDGTDDDDYINALIEAATEKLDGWNGDLGRALITQTWRADYDKFPHGRRLGLPLVPVQSVSVIYFDSDNAQQTFAASKYAVLEDASGAYLWLDEDEDHWPDTYDREDAVRVTLVVGYGDTAADVPRPVRHAILLLVAHWYEAREAVTFGKGPETLPWGVDALLTNYRRLRF